MTLVVPPVVASLIDELVARHARSTGESEDECRRAVELAVLQRGTRALQIELEGGGQLEGARVA